MQYLQMNSRDVHGYRRYPLIWWSITAFLGLQVVYRLLSLQIRTAVGLAGVWLLLLACRITWQKGWKKTALLLLFAAVILGDFCAAFLVIDAAD
jgi:hypothetical protein